FASPPHAAARAESDLLQRENVGRLIEAPLEIVGSLDLGAVIAQQPEHRHLSLPEKANRAERSRGLAVVFEQKAVEVELAEQALGDRIVAALPVRASAAPAATPAPADVHAEGHSWEVRNQGIVRPDRALKICDRVLA